MAKYTADEMRRAANILEHGAFCTDAIAMLRQAADEMDKLPSLIESRLGRAEKRQKHDIANELFDCLTWTVGNEPEVCFADLEKLGKLWKRIRRDADSIESEWEVPSV